MKIEDLLKERIEKNNKLFNKEDIEVINNNIDIFAKIYLIGIIDAKM